MKHDAVIDGELVAIGSDGLSHFQLLSRIGAGCLRSPLGIARFDSQNWVQRHEG